MPSATDVESLADHTRPTRAQKWEKAAGGVLQEAPVPQTDPENPNVKKWQNGLILHTDFITEEEENDIMKAISDLPDWMGTGKRTTVHFGPHFDYTTFATSETDSTPPPNFLTDLLPRLPVQEYLPDQFTVQYYPPGTGIPPHVDTHSAFREALYSISIGSDVPMSFKECGETEARRARAPKRSLTGKPSPPPPPPTEAQKEQDAKAEAWDLILPRRSLLIMTGASRYGFTHRIRPRKYDISNGEVRQRQGRFSITMRSIKKGEDVGCDCTFHGVCDARIREMRQQGLIDENGNLIASKLP